MVVSLVVAPKTRRHNVLFDICTVILARNQVLRCATQIPSETRRKAMLVREALSVLKRQ
jgi:hypothetical protein